MTRTALYRHLSGKSLLYVGISLSPISRTEQHRHSSPWFEQVDTIKLEWFPSREEALQAEVAAIESEKPQFNKAHAKPVSPEQRIAFIQGMLAMVSDEEADVFRGMLTSFGIDDVTDLDQWRAHVERIEGLPKEPPLDLGDD